MTVLAVIPARWQSTRFPGKPLAKIAGREMIARVWDQVVQTPSVDQTVVATDADNIAEFCQANGMDVVMTRSDHPTGSDRLAEVAEKMPADIYLNVQVIEVKVNNGLVLSKYRLSLPPYSSQSLFEN